jgi:type VI secretion system VasD/TssJ family lipoprotein
VKPCDGRSLAARARILAGGPLALLLLACRGGESKPPCESPQLVRALVQTSDRANIGEDGESWPTKLVVYQLSGTSFIDQLDPETLKQQGEKVFGDEFLDKRELTAFPTTSERTDLAVKPKATHLVVVAEFRETLGSAWYVTYTVPRGLRDAQCSAAEREEEPPVPCLYAAIEGSELSGGGFSPPGFDLDPFATTCSVIAPPKTKKKKKRKKLGKPDVDLNKQPPKAPGQDLSAPSKPSAPNKPAAPSRPGR